MDVQGGGDPGRGLCHEIGHLAGLLLLIVAIAAALDGRRGEIIAAGKQI